MSVFEDSYHPVSDVAGAEALVRRARRAGVVIPERAPYTCVLVEQPQAGTDPQLIAANTGLLVRYQFGEDHGVWLDLYEGAQPIGQLVLEWGPDFLGEGLPRGRFDPAPWLAAGLLDEARATALLQLADGMAEGKDGAAGHEAARLVGLTVFEGLSCDPARGWQRILDRVRQRHPDAIEIDVGPA